MIRRILIVAVLVALVALLNNWLSGQREDAERQQAEAGRHVPEYFLRGFVATTMDASGRPEQRLAAESMLRYADDGTMELTQPRLTLYAEGEEPWQIDAAHGLVSGDGVQVRLGGGVRVTREGGMPMELSTDDLLLRPKERYAETDAPLSITHAHGRLDAVGLRAYMQEQRLVLLSQIRGSYAPIP